MERDDAPDADSILSTSAPKSPSMRPHSSPFSSDKSRTSKFYKGENSLLNLFSILTYSNC